MLTTGLNCPYAANPVWTRVGTMCKPKGNP